MKIKLTEYIKIMGSTPNKKRNKKNTGSDEDCFRDC